MTLMILVIFSVFSRAADLGDSPVVNLLNFPPLVHPFGAGSEDFLLVHPFGAGNEIKDVSYLSLLLA